MMPTFHHILAATLFTLLSLNACLLGDNVSKFTKLDIQHLPNAIQVTPELISGGAPNGEQGFEQLKQLGIKTVISVDGAQPNVVLAKQHGLRYVHLPHAYSGISSKRSKQLAKAIVELPGPIYLHCHHGKHRSPAAAAVAVIGAGQVAKPDALQLLDLAGTSPKYQGLYRCVRQAQVYDSTELAKLEADFPEIAKVTPLVKAMAAVERNYDYLNQFKKNDWAALPNHPEVEPLHQALILREHFTELQRVRSKYTKDAEFQLLMHQSEQHVLRLEEALQKEKRDIKALNQLMHNITQSCIDCHNNYR